MPHPRFFLLVPLLTAGPLVAQMPASDSARLVVTNEGKPLGTEDFAFRKASAEGTEVVNFLATTKVGQESFRVAVTLGPTRMTVRMASPSGETAREYPGGGHSVVADERVLSLYALLAGVPPGPVTVFGPPPGGRRPGTLEDLGMRPVPGGGSPYHQLTLRSGEDVASVWLDDTGRLVRVEVPSRGLVAERVGGR